LIIIQEVAVIDRSKRLFPARGGFAGQLECPLDETDTLRLPYSLQPFAHSFSDSDGETFPCQLGQLVRELMRLRVFDV
jgi:hypothetical protein